MWEFCFSQLSNQLQQSLVYLYLLSQGFNFVSKLDTLNVEHSLIHEGKDKQEILQLFNPVPPASTNYVNCFRTKELFSAKLEMKEIDVDTLLKVLQIPQA